MSEITAALTPEQQKQQDAAIRQAIAATVVPPSQKRPDLAGLYSQLGQVSQEAPSYADVGRVGQSRVADANRDRDYGMILQGLGGKHLAPVGRQITDAALEAGKPLRMNEADIAYQDPSTGEIVENPANRQRRAEKALLAEIAGGERALSAEEARAAARQKADEDRTMRKVLADDRSANLRAIAELAAQSRADARAAKAAAAAAKGAEVPAHLQKVYLENRAKLGQVDAAIAQVKQNPDAVGAIGWLPEAVSQYVPGKSGGEGVPVRAAVADLGSMKIHDRSGAAVTAAEFPRLRPFIPNVGTDSPQTIEHKLGQFKVEYANMVSQIEQGYPLSHFIGQQRSSSGQIGGAPAAQSAGVERKTVGGKSYVKQNGQWFQE